MKLLRAAAAGQTLPGTPGLRHRPEAGAFFARRVTRRRGLVFCGSGPPGRREKRACRADSTGTRAFQVVNAHAAGSSRRGLSLFEVVIALAIFMASIAAIGQLISTGARSAVYSRLETQAVVRCESKLAEILAGITPTQQAGGGTFSDDPSWSWTVSVASAQHENLFIVDVTVSHAANSGMGRVSYSLRRLVRDRQLDMQAYETQLALEQNQSSGNSTSNGSSTGTSQ